MVLQTALSCRKPPEWPDAPFIEQYKETEYIETSGFDTIKIHLAFRDGDGNIGLEDSDTISPYHAFDILKDENGNTLFIEKGENFNIYTHAIEDINNDGKLDTFKIKPNLFRNNILFDFVRVNPLGEIIDTIDFKNLGDVGAESLNFRIEPIYKKDFTNEVYSGPIEGFIDYNIVSSFFLLPKGTYRINVRIVDRDLNVSNSVLTSPSFQKK